MERRGIILTAYAVASVALAVGMTVYITQCRGSEQPRHAPAPEATGKRPTATANPRPLHVTEGRRLHFKDCPTNNVMQCMPCPTDGVITRIEDGGIGDYYEGNTHYPSFGHNIRLDYQRPPQGEGWRIKWEVLNGAKLYVILVLKDDAGWQRWPEAAPLDFRPHDTAVVVITATHPDTSPASGNVCEPGGLPFNWEDLHRKGVDIS